MARKHPDPDIARAKALGLFDIDIFESGAGFVVDGREFPDEEANWVHWSDASCGPYWVFDVKAQDYVGEKFANLFEALAECKRHNGEAPADPVNADMLAAVKDAHHEVSTDVAGISRDEALALISTLRLNLAAALARAEGRV